jgi:hypothetical protein
MDQSHVSLRVTQHVERAARIHGYNLQFTVRSSHHIIAQQHTWPPVLIHCHRNLTTQVLSQLTLHVIQHSCIVHSIFANSHEGKRSWFHFCFQLWH